MTILCDTEPVIVINSLDSFVKRVSVIIWQGVGAVRFDDNEGFLLAIGTTSGQVKYCLNSCRI
jgi:hypothetical protein